MSRCSFTCARTCRTEERVDACRFMPLFQAIGVPVVSSHTTTVSVQFGNQGALAAAVRACGGQMIGQGVHTLFGSNEEQGIGFRLPGWRAPLVVKGGRELAYDAYGNTIEAVTLPHFTREYVFAAARIAAQENRWTVVQDTPAGLVLRHPSGGRLTVKPDGTCDASGFVGDACHASGPIEAAIGQRGTRRYKAEYNSTTVRVRR